MTDMTVEEAREAIAKARAVLEQDEAKRKHEAWRQFQDRVKQVTG